MDPKNVADETDSSVYNNETHMLRVLILFLINPIINWDFKMEKVRLMRDFLQQVPFNSTEIL